MSGHHHPGGPVLCWDVLREIALAAPRPTCATLMRTCRTFYTSPAIARAALHDEVALTDSTNVYRFLDFLEASPDGGGRFPFLRNLSIRMRRLKPSAGAMRRMVEGVPRMTGLVVLSIHHADQTLKTWGPVFVDALAALTSLRRLTLHGGGPVMAQLLSALSNANRLVALDVDWTVTVGPGRNDFFHSLPRLSEDAWRSMHPVPFLRGCASTLEELSCARWHTCPGTPAPLYAQVYPKMRRLQIEWDDHLVVAHYIRAFPNIASLHLWTGHEVVYDHLDDDARIQRIHALRDANTHQLGGASSKSYWPHLETYTGSLTHLYILSLTCRIPIIRFDEEITSDAHLPMLMDVLSRAQPVHLKFKFHAQSTVLDRPAHSSLASILQNAECAARLESLAVDMTLTRRVDRDVDVDGRLVSSVPSLHASALQLTVLRL